jgi:hypothetical protein
MVGLLVSIVLTGSNPLFPGMSGPLLVLFFFLTAAGSVIGLAVFRSRRATTEVQTRDKPVKPRGHPLRILHRSQYDSRMSAAALVVFRVQGCICIGLNPSGEGGREVSPSGRGTKWADLGTYCFIQRSNADEPERLIPGAGPDGDGVTGPAQPHCDFPIDPLRDRCHRPVGDPMCYDGPNLWDSVGYLHTGLDPRKFRNVKIDPRLVELLGVIQKE